MAHAYATVEQARQQATSRETLSDAEVATLTLNVEAASRMIDSRTGTWWDKRTGTLTTRGAQRGALRLFMPAPCLGLTAVTEDGVAVDLANVVSENAGWWLLKADGSAWSSEPNAVVLTGSWGRETVPAGIVVVAADLACVLSGLKTRIYNDAQGIQQTIAIGKLPDLMDAHLADFTALTLVNQPHTFVESV